MKINVGIFFGGPSREREISFAGGRTVYDNLDKTIFEPLPIFVDSHCNLILLDWRFVYKGSIRDFYPPVDFLPPSSNEFQIYIESLGLHTAEEQDAVIEKIGRKLTFEELPQLINVAFLALHGAYGEDGQIQQQLQDFRIPYTGSGVQASQIGMNKALQKRLMAEKGFETPQVLVVNRDIWIQSNPDDLYQEAIAQIGFPMVIRPANQGSSIGVSIIEEQSGLEGFEEAANRAFFREVIPVRTWQERSAYERVEKVRLLADIRDGIGFPMNVFFQNEVSTFYHPEQLLDFLNGKAANADLASEAFVLEGHFSEQEIIVEAFIRGKEFSCIVIRKEDGSAVGLPPTEIVKGGEVFDYRSKYMPGLSRKVTPIDLPEAQINAIRSETERLFLELGFHVYARIDGFITAENKIFLNDPNTTSGMLPSSFFFHQAAEIGLNPSQFLTYIIRTSLQERLSEAPDNQPYAALLEHLDNLILSARENESKKKRIGVILGGYSFERHISVESGRNIYEKLSSSDKYEPIPIFLTGNDRHIELYRLPINLLLKDNADDIRDKIMTFKRHGVVEEIKIECVEITHKYGSRDVIFEPRQLFFEDLKSVVDAVFIALHGRPGEDGHLQKELDKIGIPYNGSDAVSSAITIDKYRTLQTLKRNGFPVAMQLLVKKSEYEANPQDYYNKIESHFAYPFIAKPVDDGCSSAVKVINSRTQLEAFSRLMFRPLGQEGEEARRELKLKPKEEFPRKEQILLETLITQNGATRFMEITGGFLTHFNADGSLRYEMFEPSETLASGEVLSLEEKFLAGEGQNITPARFGKDYETIARQVKEDLEKAARILNVQGYARVDAFVRIYEAHRAETLIIEVNSLPGMTPATAIFHQAALSNYKPYEFIDRILSFAFEKQRRMAGIPEAPVPSLSVVEPTASVEAIAVAETEVVLPSEPTTEPMQEQQPEAPRTFKWISPFNRALLWENFKKIVNEIWLFLSSAIFLRNFVVWLGMMIALFFLTNLALRVYTNHNESLQVQNYIGMSVEEATRQARNRSFRIVILDSIQVLDKEPGIVLEQDPKPFSRVKQKRRIYITVTKYTPDMVVLPQLVGNYDYNQYARKLQQLGIRTTIRDRQFDSKLEENTILHFYYKDRQISDADLRGKVEVPKGSTLEFVVTERTTGFVEIPDLVCRKYSAAVFLISAMSLNLGTVVGEVSDDAYVWKQEPAYTPGQNIRVGEQINIYLSPDRPEGCPVADESEDFDGNTDDNSPDNNN